MTHSVVFLSGSLLSKSLSAANSAVILDPFCTPKRPPPFSPPLPSRPLSFLQPVGRVSSNNSCISGCKAPMLQAMNPEMESINRHRMCSNMTHMCITVGTHTHAHIFVYLHTLYTHAHRSTHMHTHAQTHAHTYTHDKQLRGTCWPIATPRRMPPVQSPVFAVFK